MTIAPAPTTPSLSSFPSLLPEIFKQELSFSPFSHSPIHQPRLPSFYPVAQVDLCFSSLSSSDPSPSLDTSTIQQSFLRAFSLNHCYLSPVSVALIHYYRFVFTHAHNHFPSHLHHLYYITFTLCSCNKADHYSVTKQTPTKNSNGHSQVHPSGSCGRYNSCW